MKLIAIDPGLDEIAAAVFDVERFRELQPTVQPESQAAAGALVDRHFFRTKSRTPLATRLATIAGEVCGLERAEYPCAVAIEIPAMYGRYRKERKNDAALAKLWQAIGAVTAGAAAAKLVVQMKADDMPKLNRQALVQTMLGRAGLEPAKNEHVADAIWLGIVALTTGVIDLP